MWVRVLSLLFSLVLEVSVCMSGGLDESKLLWNLFAGSGINLFKLNFELGRQILGFRKQKFFCLWLKH